MGVTGLWQLVSSTGKPVPLDSLEGKVLAVDVSVWLHQLSKGMRDGAGNPVPNAHLHGLFTRICKLLHCRIKPIFVFDGVAPELKKKTLASRRNKRDDAEENSAAMQRKILTNLIRNQALKEALGEGSPTKVPSIPKGASTGSKRDAIFELPPLPETSKAYLSHTFEDDDRGIEKRELQEFIQEEFTDLSSVDVESEDFKSLPAELQHELIEDLRASKKNYNLSKIVELPEDSKDFSNFQMEKLLKYNKLNTRLEQVRKELNTRQTRDLGKYKGEDYYGMNVDSRRVVSEDTSHYILIKGLKKKKEMEKEEQKRKSRLSTVVDNSEDSSNTDELLQESAHDSLKEIDFRKTEFKQVMEKVKLSDDKKEIERKSEVKKIGDNVERFKAVIEFDSDSNSSDSEIESTGSNNRQNRFDIGLTSKDVRPMSNPNLKEGMKDNITIVEDDDDNIEISEDAELQYAIELSLKELRNKKSEPERLLSEKMKSKKTSDSKADKNVCKSVSKSSKMINMKGTSIAGKNRNQPKLKSSSVDKVMLEEDSNEKSKRITRSSSNKEQIEYLENGSQPDTKKSINSKLKASNILKRRKSNMSCDSLEEEKRPNILKRRKSNMSNDSIEEEGANVLKRKKTDMSDEIIEGKRQRISKRRKSNTSTDSLDEKISKKRKMNEESETPMTVNLDDKEEWPKRRTVISEPDAVMKQEENENRSEGSSESDEEEFLEVAIDLTAVKEDELFPASMFEVTSAGEENPDFGRKPLKPPTPVKKTKETTFSKTVDVSFKPSTPGNQSTANTNEDNESVEAESVSGSEDDVDDDNASDQQEHDKDDEVEDDVDDNVDDNVASMQQDDGKNLESDDKNSDSDNKEDNDDSDEVEEIQLKDNENRTEIRELATDIEQENSKPENEQGILEENKDLDEIEEDSDLIESGIDNEDKVDVEVEVTSPKTQDLVKAFKSMEEPNIRGLKASYEKETRQLIQEQGRQARMASSITDQMHADAQELLQLFGIPFIVSPSEAEAQCAQLDKANLTQGTITDDSDIWLFGGKVVFKNFFNQAKYVECFKDVHIKSQLGLSRENLINIALLCGSDYTEGLQGVGPVTAMEILAEFPGEGIEGLVQLRSWWEAAQQQIKIPSESKLLSKLRSVDINPGFPSVQVVDAYLCPMVDDSSEKFTWALPDLDQLRQNSKLGWTKEKTDELIVPVLKRLNYKQTQRAINSFFQPEVYIQPAKMKSKRLQNVVNKFLNVEQPSDATGVATQSDDEPKPKKGRGKAKDKTHTDNDAENSMDIDIGTEDTDSNDKPAKGKGAVKGGKGKGKAKKDKNAEDIKEEADDIVDNEMGKKTGKGRGRPKGSTRGKALAKDVTKDDNEGEEEVSKYFENKERSDTGKTRRGKGSSLVKGKGRGKRSIEHDDAESVDAGSELDYNSSEVSGTSDSASDSDSDMSDSDGNEITESSLSVAEILGLKIGDSKFEKAAKKNEITASTSGVTQQMRVFESGLNVGEIMQLQIGEKNEVETDHGNSEVDMEINVTDDNVNTDKTEESEWEDSEFYKNEGGFIREDSEEMSVENTIAKNVSCNLKSITNKKGQNLQEIAKEFTDDKQSYETDSVINPRNSTKKKDVNESTKIQKQNNTELQSKVLNKEDLSSKDTKQSKRVTRGRKSKDEKERKVIEEVREDDNENHSEAKSELDKAETIEIKQKVTNVEENVQNTYKENNLKEKTSETSEVSTKTSKKTTKGKKAVKVEEELEQVPLEYSTEPIKRIVSGVPWADLGKKRGRKGKVGGGLGGLKRNMEPVEKLEKKEKSIKAAARYPVGCVNLSESDSDSSS